MEKQILFYNLGDIANMSQEENNRLFVKIASQNMYKGKAEMDKWLSELVSDYMIRCGKDLSDQNKKICFEKWKMNTIFIIDNADAYISKWCKKCRIDGGGSFRLSIK